MLKFYCLIQKCYCENEKFRFFLDFFWTFFLDIYFTTPTNFVSLYNFLLNLTLEFNILLIGCFLSRHPCDLITFMFSFLKIAIHVNKCILFVFLQNQVRVFLSLLFFFLLTANILLIFFNILIFTARRFVIITYFTNNILIFLFTNDIIFLFCLL